MRDPGSELQAAIVAHLRASSALSAKIGARIYDRVPASPALPYISLGPSDAVPFTARCIDGALTTMQIDVWSNAPGSNECRDVTALAANHLHHASLAVIGHSVSRVFVLSTTIEADPDGVTTRGRITVEINTAEISV